MGGKLTCPVWESHYVSKNGLERGDRCIGMSAVGLHRVDDMLVILGVFQGGGVNHLENQENVQWCLSMDRLRNILTS